MPLTLPLDAADDWPESKASPGRPFQLIDAMILLAALLVALAWDRERLHDPWRFAPGVLMPSGWFWQLVKEVAAAVAFLPPFLALGSLAVLVLRLRQPRPSLREVIWEPGLVASLQATLFVIATCALVLASHLASGRPFPLAWARTVQDLRPENLMVPSTVIGFGVLIAWLVLRVRQRWRPEPGWIDRLGRLLGLGWIAMILGGLLLPILALAGLAAFAG